VTHKYFHIINVMYCRHDHCLIYLSPLLLQVVTTVAFLWLS
jgi:hypothetical protein